MARKRKASPGFSRLFIPLCLALVPILLLGGNPAQPALAGLPVATTQQAQSRPETLVLRVYFRSIAERDRLATELNAEEMSTTGGFLTVLADRALYNNIVARGLRVEIDEEGTTQLNNPNLFGHDDDPNTFNGGYRTVEEMQTFLTQQATNHPTLAEVVDVGNSWCKEHAPCQITNLTWNGYDILALHITNSAIPGPKPVYWFETGIHSREIATSEIAMRYISYLLDNYDNNAEVHWLVDYQDIWVVPMLNPDGHHMVETGGNNPIGQRKNANYNNGCTSWGSSSFQLGTDNNRNFPFLWGCCGGSSTASCDQTYRGTSSGSEPETQATVNKLRSLIPDQRGPLITDAAPITTTGVYQSMHSSASLNLFPWGFQVTPHAPNDADLRNIARHLQAANAYPSGNGYTVGQPPEVLYAVDGDTADWGYGELGVASYTTEIGGGSFYPPYSTIDSSIWPLNRGALLYQAKVARTPYLLAHGPDANNAVTNPMTVTQGIPSLLTATINYAWTSNAFSQNVAAAEYYIDTPPWAGGTAIAMTPTDGNFNSPTEGAQATIDTTSIPVGRHLIFVRGRGVNNYGGFETWGPISAAWLTITSSGGPTPTNTVAPPTATRTNTPAPPTATATCVPAGSTQDVSIGDSFFNPPSLTIPAGTTVRWTNTEGSHSSTSDTAIWDSGVLAVGGQFSYTFNTPGSYPYHCSVHPTIMTGTITVQSGGICATSTSTRTNTPLPPTATRTNTPVPPTATATRTNTPVPPSSTATRTNTPVPPTSTRTNTPVVPTQTPGGPSATPEPPTATRTNTPVPPPTSTATSTVVPSATSTACTITFSDVDPDNTFYTFIRCLACRFIISGYDDGTFRPFNDITRGQIAKMVSNAAGFDEDPGPQVYEDTPPASPFYQWINRLSNRGHMGGYPCGLLPDEPCIEPDNRPYFRPANSATRGQLSKIVANAAGLDSTPSGQFYTDVDESHPFYLWIMRLTELGVMGGYDCGGEGEPCDPDNRPYFRPYNNVTRGQASKIVANTFFPGCQTPTRP